MGTLAVIAFLLFVNLFYVLADFAAVGVRKSRIQQLEEEGNRLAAELLPILEDPRALDRYIAACQIGITFSSLLLGAYAEGALALELAPLLESALEVSAAAAFSTAAAAILLVLTFIQMLIGELIPKSLALQFPVQAALLTVLPMQWSTAAMGGFIRALNGSGALILKLFRAPQVGQRHVHSPDEIEMLIAESKKGGLLDAEEHTRLHRALKLGKRTAKELMVPRDNILALDIDTPPQECLRKVAASPYTRIPIYRADLNQVVGALHAKEIITHYLRRSTVPELSDVLHPIPSVAEDAPADRVLAQLKKKRTHQAIVKNAKGDVVGLVTLEDILTEIVGDLGDELKGPPRPRRTADGRFLIPGQMSLQRASNLLGVRLRSNGAKSIGERVERELGNRVRKGAKATLEGAEFEVARLDGKTVLALLGRKTGPPRATTRKMK